MRRLRRAGPYAATGSGETASRRKIFVCRPRGQTDEDECATRIITTLARRAYRRPIVKDEIPSLMAPYRAARDAGGLEKYVDGLVARNRGLMAQSSEEYAAGVDLVIEAVDIQRAAMAKYPADADIRP